MRRIISHKRDHNLRVTVRSLQRFLELVDNLGLRRYGFSNAWNERMRRVCCERISFVSPPSCSALGRYILSTGSQVNWKFSVPPTQWRDISPEVSAEPIPREVIVRVSDSHIASTCTAPALAGPCHATFVCYSCRREAATSWTLGRVSFIVVYNPWNSYTEYASIITPDGSSCRRVHKPTPWPLGYPSRW